MQSRKKRRKIVCISFLICLTYNSMFCHISFTFEISYISTICSLSSNYSTFSFKVASISISSKTISSINRIFSSRKNFCSLDAFTRTKPRANFTKRICSKLHTLHLPSNFLQLQSDFLFLLLAFLKQLLQLSGEIRHFLLKWHSIAFVFSDSYVSSRS